MLIRDGRRDGEMGAPPAAAADGGKDGWTGSRDRRRRRSAQWPHSVARFMGEIANRDGNLAIEKGGICRTDATKLLQIAKDTLHIFEIAGPTLVLSTVSFILCACVPMQANGLTYM